MIEIKRRETYRSVGTVDAGSEPIMALQTFIGVREFGLRFEC